MQWDPGKSALSHNLKLIAV